MAHFTLAVHDDLGIFGHGICTGGLGSLGSLGSGGDNDGLGEQRRGEGGAGKKGEAVERTAHIWVPRLMNVGQPVTGECCAAMLIG